MQLRAVALRARRFPRAGSDPFCPAHWGSPLLLPPELVSAAPRSLRRRFSLAKDAKPGWKRSGRSPFLQPGKSRFWRGSARPEEAGPGEPCWAAGAGELRDLRPGRWLSSRGWTPARHAWERAAQTCHASRRRCLERLCNEPVWKTEFKFKKGSGEGGSEGPALLSCKPPCIAAGMGGGQRKHRGLRWPPISCWKKSHDCKANRSASDAPAEKGGLRLWALLLCSAIGRKRSTLEEPRGWITPAQRVASSGLLSCFLGASEGLLCN